MVSGKNYTACKSKGFISELDYKRSRLQAYIDIYEFI